jgi:prepilin-type N-terminal cleavage/methylation domain-containing protein
MIKKPNKGFSLVELSIVILIVGVLIAGVSQGIDLLQDSRLAAARMLTQSSRVNSIKNLVTWLETTSEKSFVSTEAVEDSTVTNWYDINPQLIDKNNAQQTIAASKPLYVANCINNLPCLDFDGTNDYMNSVLAIGATSGMSVFAVVRSDDITRSGTTFSIIGSGSNVGGAAFNLKVWDTASAVFMYTVPGQSQGLNAITKYGPVTSKANYLVEVINDPTPTSDAPPYYSKIWVNKIAGTSYAANLPITNIGILNIGHFNNANYLNGKIAELIIFDRAVTTKERLSIESYLSKKWNF